MNDKARKAARRLEQIASRSIHATVLASDAIDSMVRAISPRAIFWTAVGFNLLLIITAVSLLTLPRTSAFIVDAQTEVLSVKVNPGGRLPKTWQGQGQTLRRDDGCTSFEFYQPAATTLRVSLVWRPEGPWLQAENIGNPRIPYGVLTCPKGNRKVFGNEGWWAFPAIALDRTAVFEGEVSLGQLPGASPNNLLTAGKVTASSASLPFRSARAIAQSDLFLGDEVRLYGDARAQREVNGTAIVRVEQTASVFHVVLKAPAAVAEVKRLGIADQVLLARAPSIWARIQAQSEWTIVVLVLALVINILGVTRHYSDSTRNHSRAREACEEQQH